MRPMKRSIVFLFIVFLPALAWAENVYVTVRETQLRAKPDFLSKGAALRYGDSLTVLSDSQSWINVKTISGQQGYVHRSAISERRIVLKGQSSFVSSGASQNDVVMAGKGFSSEVENQYSSKNPVLDFRTVDAMERPRVAPADLSSFVKQGQLNGGAL